MNAEPPTLESIPTPLSVQIGDLDLALRAKASLQGSDPNDKFAKRFCERCGNSDPSIRSLNLDIGQNYTLCEPCRDFAHQEIRNIYR